MRARTITLWLALWLASIGFAAGAHGAAIDAEAHTTALDGEVGASASSDEHAIGPAGHAASDAEAGVANADVDGEFAGNVDAKIDAAAKGDLRLATLVPVDSIPALGRLHSWSVVDNETLIIWAAPSRPYLVELFRPSPELRFALSIGVTSFGSRIHARFDSVEVDGFSYPIRRIYQMSRDEAEALQATS